MCILVAEKWLKSIYYSMFCVFFMRFRGSDCWYLSVNIQILLLHIAAESIYFDRYKFSGLTVSLFAFSLSQSSFNWKWMLRIKQLDTRNTHSSIHTNSINIDAVCAKCVKNRKINSFLRPKFLIQSHIFSLMFSIWDAMHINK